MSNERTLSAAPIASFLGVVILGGSNFVAVRYSNQELEPLWGAGLRFSFAALLFIGAALVWRVPWPRGRLLLFTLIYGALNFAVSYALMYWALVRVTAGVATVVLATVPLVTLLLAVAQGLERLPARSVVGGLLAVVGIAWMALGSTELTIPVGAFLAIGAAALCMGESLILAKQLSGNHPVVTNAVGMAVGAILLLTLSAVVGESWTRPEHTETILALGYLVTLGSVGLFVLVLLVARRWTASATSYAFVLFPVVAMTLDAAILGEPITIAALGGALLVMIGVWFGALSRGAQRTVATASTRPAPMADRG